MWVLVHVTDSIRPTDAYVTFPLPPPVRGIVAAEEGTAASARESDRSSTPGHELTDLARRRHRKARGLGGIALALRRRAQPAA